MVVFEAINEKLGRSKVVKAKSPDELRQNSNEFQESDGIDYDLILQICEEIERSNKGMWTFVDDQRDLPRNPTEGAVLMSDPVLGNSCFL